MKKPVLFKTTFFLKVLVIFLIFLRYTDITVYNKYLMLRIEVLYFKKLSLLYSETTVV